MPHQYFAVTPLLMLQRIDNVFDVPFARTRPVPSNVIDVEDAVSDVVGFKTFEPVVSDTALASAPSKSWQFVRSVRVPVVS